MANFTASSRPEIAGERAMRQMYEYMWPKQAWEGPNISKHWTHPHKLDSSFDFSSFLCTVEGPLVRTSNKTMSHCFQVVSRRKIRNLEAFDKKKSREKSAKKRQVTVRATKAIFRLNPQASEWNGYGTGEKGARTDSECVACGNDHRWTYESSPSTLQLSTLATHGS